MSTGTEGRTALLAEPSARPLRTTVTGIELSPRMPYEAWYALGQKLARYCNGTAWWLGDWLAFGEAKYGRRYRDAVAASGLDAKTLRNYAVVARRFEMSRRRDNLSFQHHAEVCALDDAAQEHWLDLAAGAGWSRNELRRRLRAALRSDEPPHGNGSSLAFDSTRLGRWRRAAERSEQQLDVWICHALDEAADAVLQDD